MTTTATFLVVAACVLTIIAFIITFALRWQALVTAKPMGQAAARLDAAKDDPRAFEAAVTASQEASRAIMSRIERTRKALTPVTFGLSGLTVICALAALFLTGDREAAIVGGMFALISVSFTTATYLSAKHVRQKAAHSAL